MIGARLTAFVMSLSLLLAGIAVAPHAAQAAPWISGGDSFASDWVAKIEQELLKKEYRYVFANDPRTPQASILRWLNRAAQAQAAHNDAMAKDFATQAIRVLEEGVQKHYYSAEDVEPLLKRIREQIPIKAS
jgi:hypothetical protein